MKTTILIIILVIVSSFLGCEKEKQNSLENTTDQITIDSLVANHYTVKAWDTTTISCYAMGADLIYYWECNHGSLNGAGSQVKYTAGECCLGINTIICKVSNETGQVVKNIQIEVTSYFEGGN